MASSGDNLLSGKTVLITGASQGVGEVLCCCLARHGAKKLIMVAEDMQGIKQVNRHVSEGAANECEWEFAAALWICCQLPLPVTPLLVVLPPCCRPRRSASLKATAAASAASATCLTRWPCRSWQTWLPA